MMKTTGCNFAWRSFGSVSTKRPTTKRARACKTHHATENAHCTRGDGHGRIARRAATRVDADYHASACGAQAVFIDELAAR